MNHLACSLRNSLLALSALALSGVDSAAQCPSQWTHIPVTAPTGQGSPVTVCENWDPDGAGPAPSQLVIGGSFTGVAGTLANSVATFDSNAQAWSTFGAGGPGMLVAAMAGAPNGDLIVSMSLPAGAISVWDGVSWSPLPGFDNIASSLAVLPNGNIVATGSFTTAGGVSVNGLAVWDGTSWSPMGTPPQAGAGKVHVRPNGDLILASNGLYSWNGITWIPITVGTSALPAFVVDYHFLQNGDIAASGVFISLTNGSQERVAVWDGADWNLLGFQVTATAGPVLTVTGLPNGDIVAAGFFTTAAGINATNVARWDGSNWNPIGLGLAAGFTGAQVFDLCTTPEGILYAGGAFNDPTDSFQTNLAATNANCSTGPGLDYCSSLPNSTGNPASFTATGSPSVVANNLQFNTTSVPANSPGIYYYGTAQVSLPFGDGTRCVGGSIFRLPVINSGPTGVLAYSPDLTNPPQPAGMVLAGSSWNFQAWFRDPAAAASGFNLSNGVEIAFVP
jgi:hypothetical protein